MTSDRGKEYVPPGYRRLGDVSNEIGRGPLRDQLALGTQSAFRIDGHGLILAVAREDWVASTGDGMIDTGYWAPSAYEDGPAGKTLPPFVTADLLLLRENTPPVQERAATAASGYVPPFIELMLEAVRHFKITTTNSAPVKKKLTHWFKGKSLPNGIKISKNQAGYMATFCRAPEQMRGGRAKG